MTRWSGVAVVTGGTRGIGGAIANALHERGCTVLAAARRPSPIPVPYETCLVDVTLPADRERLFNRAAELGGVRYFVGAAGVGGGKLAKDVGESDLRDMLAVHVEASFFCAQAASVQMRSQSGGSIVLVTSIWGHSGAVGTLAYGAAKAAESHTVRVLALEWARDSIRVNGLAPGLVDTEMTAGLSEAQRAKMAERIPLGRAAQPQEMVGPALFLLGDDASYVTGHVLVADGGELAR